MVRKGRLFHDHGRNNERVENGEAHRAIHMVECDTDFQWLRRVNRPPPRMRHSSRPKSPVP